jgi:hypothetical protein
MIRKNDFKKDLSSDTEAECVRIRMSVYDSHSCRGPQVNVTLPLRVELDPSDKASSLPVNLLFAKLKLIKAFPPSRGCR